MGEPVRMLTPSEIQKLPKCKYSYFAQCGVETPKTCLQCLLESINRALILKDPVDANNLLHALLELLKEQKLLEAEP